MADKYTPVSIVEPLADHHHPSAHSRKNSSEAIHQATHDRPQHDENHLEEPEIHISEPLIVAPAPVRPAAIPVQPQGSVWAKRARLTKKASSYRSRDSSPSYPPVSLKPHRSSYIPVVPSPLNPASSGSEGDASTGGRPSHSSSESREVVANGSGSFGNSASSEPVRKSQIVYSTPTLPHASFMDLGREYDRYPARTPRHSVMSLARVSYDGGTTPKRHSVPLTVSSEQFEGSDPEKGSFMFTSESYTKPTLIDAGIPLYMDEKEDDDYIHNPGKDYNPKRGPLIQEFGWKPALRFGSFWLFIVGLVCLFIVLPVLTYNGFVYTPPTHQEPSPELFLSPWEYVKTDYVFPILSGIRTSMVDPDTPEWAKTRKSVDGKDLKLVFSDEFNVDGRTFYEGDDQFWTAPDLHYAATQDEEWYDPDAVTTSGGTLRLTLDAFVNHNLDYRSGMLQSWNKLCFKGGVLEVSASLPGPGGKMGLWPGIWTLGNLARPGYLSTSEGVWPYTYDSCDVGITPNQSSPDGISFLPGQKLASCTCNGEDHPNAGVGRGAPEIDALEGSVSGTDFGNIGVASQSSQIAPYDIWYTPDYDYLEIHNYSVTTMNEWRGGPFQQAVSGVTVLNNDWYDGKVYQKYAFEYKPGKEEGKITWFVGDEPTFSMSGESTRPNGNIGHRLVSEEPMSIILNLGISKSWVYIDWNALKFPTTMYIDYVRIYQPEGSESVTCDPEGYPTTQYIKDHMNAYTNPNLTSWKSAGYEFPKNTFMHGCAAN